MGRRAYPAVVHIDEGNKSRKSKKELEDRKEAEAKLTFDDDSILPPRWLNTQEKKMFRQMVKEFQATKLLKNIDINNLAMYCNAMQDYINLNNLINEQGYTTPEGKTNPLLNKKKQAYEQVVRIGSAFGLSPADRAKLALADTKTGDKDQDDSIANRA